MGIFSEKTTIDPMEGYTAEQRKAVEAYQSLAATGSGGGITLGEGYDGALGAYDTSGYQTSYDQLQDLYNGQDIQNARNTYIDLANTEFDPSDPKSGYAAYSRALASSGQESADVLNREAAMTGSRFGTGIQNQKADLASDLANQRGMFLSDLYQQGRQQQLAGAQGLQGLVGTQAGLSTSGANQAAAINQMKNQEAVDKYGEFQRQRSEEMSQIGMMSDQMMNPLGSYEVKGQSALGSLMGPLGTAAGFMLGGPMGAAIGGSLGTAIGGGDTGGANSTMATALQGSKYKGLLSGWGQGTAASSASPSYMQGYNPSYASSVSPSAWTFGGMA